MLSRCEMRFYICQLWLGFQQNDREDVLDGVISLRDGKSLLQSIGLVAFPRRRSTLKEEGAGTKAALSAAQTDHRTSSAMQAHLYPMSLQLPSFLACPKSWITEEFCT